MKYDFETIWERLGKDATAVDLIGKPLPGIPAPKAPREGFCAIPMWVADMNFATAPSIPQALVRRAEHPLYGYFVPTDEYFDSIISWQHDRNGVRGLTKECIGYENGVLGCIASALTAFTVPGEKVLIHSPTYIGFTHVFEDTGRTPEHTPLKKDADGVWRMDYEDMEARLAHNNIHTAIFCSPHNPSGRVWEREEIERAMAIFKKYDVTVISDEIWSDLILNGNRHIPTQSVSEDARMRTVAVYAPSKTFNLAGLVGSYHIVYDRCLRDRLVRASEGTHYNMMNVMSMHALIAAYDPVGREWTDELLQVLSDNVNYACDFIAENFPGVSLMRPQGTYLLYLDCSAYCREKGIDIQTVIERGWDVGVAWQDGTDFLEPDTIRVNLALPKKLVIEAFDRMKRYVFI